MLQPTQLVGAQLDQNGRFLTLVDDGLIARDVGPWAEEKYRLVHHYANIFATSMKLKWPRRVYVDLFAGAGRARVEGRGLLPTSPTIAMSVVDRFTHYVFGELENEDAEALAHRAACIGVEPSIIVGDSNANVARIIDAIGPRRGTLTFCFADPYRVADLAFDTITQIDGSGPVDFLILIPSFMDIHRNERVYLDEDSQRIDCFLGSTGWRDRWDGSSFGLFVAGEFVRSMRKLGYLATREDLYLVKNSRGTPLYHLGFFSKSKVGMKFWTKARRARAPQMSLPFEF